MEVIGKTLMDLIKTVLAKKKVIGDICLNIIATALPVAVLQLVIYPNVARVIGGDEYGLMLTIYSIWIMVSNSLGNVLNNIKLLRFPQYQQIGENGDIALLLRRWISGSSLIIFIVIWIYCGNFTASHILIGTIIGVCILLKSYLEVGFRIKLNYIAILINNGLLSVGFFAGYLIFRLSGLWECIFLFGYLFSCIYCAFRTHLLSEKPQKTIIHKDVKKDAYSLLVAALINSLINYADKLVLYPLMGGTAVSIYYTATILGKITGMLTGPINSVILSYITRWDKSRSGFFFKMLIIGSIVVSLGYVVTLIIARPVIGFLFPQWLEEVMEILPITTVTIMLTVLASFLQPFVMKYCKMQWQIAISGIGSLSYFLFALILWNILGLKGFCIGTIIGITTKLLIMIIVYFNNVKEASE